ncbi:hypothetical protein Q5H93_12410 [Hymenobacter sp. ASUV-10]|uniref:Uncharacterized protein n=1 Tax=Hymenobacter aranciens TaxID=3063996 RepID=A0ABT9BBB8_9BACT|nr:hypothetical protein [Hymenobacter sp. ASUV-10]MDO7875538.1 hypothetical protein [Hymenobacter sp. ASUV-10]
MATSVAAQTLAVDQQAVYAHPVTHPDVALTQQAFRLGQHFDQAGWETLAAGLRLKSHPIHSYLGFYPNHSLQSSLLLLAKLLPLHPTAAQVEFVRTLPPTAGGLRYRIYGNGFGEEFVGEPVSGRDVHQLYKQLDKLVLERRQTDYERLSDVLLRRATKVRKLKEALPVLQFMVDSTGQVLDVTVDKKRTKMGLTARSRKIILTALRNERFRALEARRVFTKPRPFAEKVHHASSRLANTAHRLIVGIHFRRQYALDRCGPHSQKQARRMMRYQRTLLIHRH